MKLFLKVFLFLTFIIQVNIIVGQENEFIQGKVVSSNDNKAIPFATIRIKDTNIGLISNDDGSFKIPQELQNSDTKLEISSIGFMTKVVLVSELNKNLINQIALEEKTEELDQVLIVTKKKRERKSAAEIIRSAIEKIPENYPFRPFSYVGYYRDYQKKEEKYLNLNEALLEVFDPGFGTLDMQGTQTRIYKYKKNTDFTVDTIAAKPYDKKRKVISGATLTARGGNEYTILRVHDAIRNYIVNSYDFVNQFNVDFVKNHELSLLSDTYIDNTPLYTIGIYKTIQGFRVIGKILVSKDNFRIYKLQYQVYDKIRVKELSEKSVMDGKKIGRLLYDILLEYQFIKGKMYPNYISLSNSFNVRRPSKFSLADAKIKFVKNVNNITFERFELMFNNNFIIEDALKKANYKLKYKNTKLKIDRIEVKEKKAVLYVNKKLTLDSKNALSDQGIINDISLKVKNIRDIDGNIIDKEEVEDYYQFREFFVQELKAISRKPLDTLFMNKYNPIFKGQPIAPFKDLSKYWLNTPLKN